MNPQITRRESLSKFLLDNREAESGADTALNELNSQLNSSVASEVYEEEFKDGFSQVGRLI